MKRNLIILSSLLILTAMIEAMSAEVNNSNDEPKAEIQKESETVKALEQEQRALLEQTKTKVDSAPTNEVEATQLEEIKKREAEIQRMIDEYDNRPHKTVVTQRTTSVEQAMFFKALQEKMERIGTCKFPKKDGKKMYGKLVVSIPIYQDGTIYQKDGGAKVEKTSGIPELDTAALNLITKAAPFAHIPNSARSPEGNDVWEVITVFNFTREGDDDPKSKTPPVDCKGIK